MLVKGQNRDLPRITIITPCLNGERHIAEAIESVLRQGYPNWEHIVVDGASTDGTAALLRQYRHLTVISEPDRGSHDAMNKGISRASGDVIGFLNVDDCYADDALLRVGGAFAANPGSEVAIGDSVVYEDAEPGRRVVRFVYAHPRGLWLTECVFGNPGINGWFFRRSVFAEVGLFDNTFHITADRDFVVRTAVAELPNVRLDAPILWYRAHGRSQNMNRERSNIVAIAGELFRMAGAFLEANRDPGRRAGLARAWHAFEGARLVFISASRGQWSAALRLFVRGTLQNPLWPFYLPRALILRRLARQSYRGGWNADLSADAEPARAPVIAAREPKAAPHNGR